MQAKKYLNISRTAKDLSFTCYKKGSTPGSVWIYTLLVLKLCVGNMWVFYVKSWVKLTSRHTQQQVWPRLACFPVHGRVGGCHQALTVGVAYVDSLEQGMPSLIHYYPHLCLDFLGYCKILQSKNNLKHAFNWVLEVISTNGRRFLCSWIVLNNMTRLILLR